MRRLAEVANGAKRAASKEEPYPPGAEEKFPKQPISLPGGRSLERRRVSMKKRWDEALRSLARRSQGPFRALAYGVTAAPGGEAELAADLGILLRREGFTEDRERCVEVADPFVGAAQRPLFRSRVLPWIKVGQRPSGPAPNAAQDRRDLESIAAGLAGFLDRMDEPGSGFRLLPEATPPPADAEREVVSMVVVRRFEDLGCDAEGIAAAIEAVLVRGGHLYIVADALDTRTREGRAAAGLAIRLGGIKAARARERSLQDLQRRREGLQVYGPVPFGFTRRGQGLEPIPEQIETVARARELARRGVSLLETALALNRERRTWKDGSPWTWRRVRQVLHNSIYDQSLRERLA
jgi:hypothetical protein